MAPDVMQPISCLPTTAAQREIWTASQLGDEASLAYNEAVAISLAGDLDRDALRFALDTVVARHEALRGHVSTDGTTFEIAPAATVLLEAHDLSALDAVAQQAAVLAHEAELVGAPFALASGPLLRASLIGLASAQHVLYLAAHHIVCDGWSFGVMATELGEAYTAALQQRAPRLPPADSVDAWCAALAEEEDAPETATAKAWWLAQFLDDVPPLALPVDRPRDTERRFTAGRVDCVIDAGTVSALRAAAQRDTSLFTLLLTTFASVLQRLTQQETIVIGVPTAGQARLGMPTLVNHCVHLLPLRLEFHERTAVADLARLVRARLLDALDHQQITYGAMLEELPLRRDRARPPLVQAVFNVDKGLDSETLGFDGCEATLRAVPRRYENFELFLNAVDLGDTITLELQYSTALFDEATAARWLTAFTQVAAALPDALAQATVAVNSLPVLTAADREAIAAFSHTSLVPVDESRLVATRIAEMAALQPDAVAITAGAASMSYAEFDAEVNRLARALRARGVTRASAVGVLVPRDARAPMAMIATWRAGGAYVPLDPELPDARLHFIMADAGITHFVTTTTLSARGSGGPYVTVDIEADANAIAVLDRAALPPSGHDAQPADAAFVIYTSGSTGTPKGCLNTQRGLLNFVLSNEGFAGPRRGGVTLSMAAPGFDASVGEMAMALMAGARLVLVTRDVAADGRRLSALIAAEQVTLLFSTPSLFRLLIDADWKGQRGLTIASGGEAMTHELAVALAQRADEVWNVYGPTETAVWVCVSKLTPVPDRITLGRPLQNTRLAILDTDGQPVPIGVPGELWIAGPNVAQGYLHRDALTAERFAPDPVSPGGLQYRTGDRVRWLANGEVEYLGRFDDQVKLRGYRVELGEIAAALRACDGVAAAEVLVREDHAGDKRLVAYVQPVAGATLPDGTLRQILAARLPAYMVPQAYVTMATWPMLPSGKVNRHALPAPAQQVVATATPFRGPTNERERHVAEAWARALRVPRVSVDDDFFEIGGHSLLASLVLSDLRARHGLDVPYRLFFEAPTVAQLAVAIDAHLANNPGAPVASPIVRRTLGPTSPATVQQIRNWMVERMHPEHGYVLVHGGAWRILGPLHVDRLTQALDDVIARQESMRTGFEVRDGVLQQVVHDTVPFSLRRVSVEALPIEEREAAMMAVCAASRAEPLDMRQPPMFRATLVRIDAAQHVLFTLQHSLVWDGYSFDVFLSDLSHAYVARESGRPPAWEPLPIRYRDYAEWQPAHFASAAVAGQRTWWQQRLPDPLPLLALPTDAVRTARPSYAGGYVQLRLSRAEADLWQQAAKREGATLYQYLLTAFHVLLHRYSGQEALLVGMPLRNRAFHELDHLVGSFTNTVPLFTELSPTEPFAALLRRLRTVCVEAIENQEVPFELLERRAPSLRAVFSMQDATGRPQRLGPCELEQFTMAEHTAASDLTLWAMQYPSSLLLVVNFRTDLFRTETIELLLAHVRRVAHDAASEPARAIGRFLPSEPAATDVPSTNVALPWSAPSAAVWARALDAAAGLKQLGCQSGDVVVVRCRRDADGTALQLAALHSGVTLLRLALDESDDYLAHVADVARARAVVADVAPRLAVSAPVYTMTAVVAAAPSAATAPFEALRWPREGAPAAWVWHGADGLSIHRIDGASLHRQARALADAIALDTSDTMVDLVSGAGDGPVTGALSTLLAGASRIAPDDADELEGEELVPLLMNADVSVVLLEDRHVRELQRVQWDGNRSLRVLQIGPVDEARREWLSARVGSYRLAIEAIGVPGVVAVQQAEEAWHPQVLSARAATVRDAQGSEPAWLVPGALMLPETAAPGAPALSARRRPSHIDLEGAPPAAQWLGGTWILDEVMASVVRTATGATDTRVQRCPDNAASPRLVAYLCGTAARSASDLRAMLKRELPRRAIPSFALAVTEWPRTDAGEVDLARLPNPARHLTTPRRTTLDTQMEQLLGRLWCELLGVTTVTPDDNFFARGGYSLLCFQLLDRVEKDTGRPLGPRVILFGTLEQAARELTDIGARTAP